MSITSCYKEFKETYCCFNVHTFELPSLDPGMLLGFLPMYSDIEHICLSPQDIYIYIFFFFSDFVRLSNFFFPNNFHLWDWFIITSLLMRTLHCVIYGGSTCSWCVVLDLGIICTSFWCKQGGSKLNPIWHCSLRASKCKSWPYSQNPAFVVTAVVWFYHSFELIKSW